MRLEARLQPFFGGKLEENLTASVDKARELLACEGRIKRWGKPKRLQLWLSDEV